MYVYLPTSIAQYVGWTERPGDTNNCPHKTNNEQEMNLAFLDKMRAIRQAIVRDARRLRALITIGSRKHTNCICAPFR